MGFVKWNKGHTPVNSFQHSVRTRDLHTARSKKTDCGTDSDSQSGSRSHLEVLLDFSPHKHIECVLKSSHVCQTYFLPHKRSQS